MVPAVADFDDFVNYQGHLTDRAGNPIDDILDMEFSFWTAAVGGTQVWSEVWDGTTTPVIVTGGYYSVSLGLYSPLGFVFEDNDALWLEIVIGTERRFRRG